MKTFNAYYRVTARKNGGTAAVWTTTDYAEACRFFKDYAEGYGNYNGFLRRLGNEENDYIISLDVVDADTELFAEIRQMEV